MAVDCNRAIVHWMMAAGKRARVHDAPRCIHCDDVIGIYEPLVYVDGAVRRTTSRAAERDVCASGSCYHATCYEQVGAGDLPDR